MDVALAAVEARGKEEAQDGWADPRQLAPAETVSAQIVDIKWPTRQVNPATARSVPNVARRWRANNLIYQNGWGLELKDPKFLMIPTLQSPASNLKTGMT